MDVHTHVFSSRPEQAQKLLANMQSSGIEKTFVYSFGYVAPLDRQDKARVENEYTAQLVAEHPSEFIGFCGVPILATWATVEIDHCAAIGLHGVKLHPPANHVDLRDPIALNALGAILTSAGKNKMVVTIDSGLFDTFADKKLVLLIRDHLDVNVILAHAFYYEYRMMQMVAELYRRAPNSPRNIYVDVSSIIFQYAHHFERDDWMWHLRQLPGRVLFGSDDPSVDFTAPSTLAVFNELPWTEQEKLEILDLNAHELMSTMRMDPTSQSR